jgi:hypothetical protein
MDAKILTRAYDLYVYAVIVLAAVLILAIVVPNSRPLWGHFMWEMYQTPSVSAVLAFLLLYQPTFMDILPQYIVYLVVSPLLLRWVARGYWREVLGGSILLWLAVQLGWHLPGLRIIEETVREVAPGFTLRSHFNPLAWPVGVRRRPAAGRRRDARAAGLERLVFTRPHIPAQGFDRDRGGVHVL